MLGLVQITVIAVGMRFFERRWPLEKPGKDDKLIVVDRVYTVLNKLGIIPLAIFIVTYPLVQEIELTGADAGASRRRAWSALLPWIGDNDCSSPSSSTSCSTTSPPTGCTGGSTPSAGGGRCTACITASAGMTVWTDDRNHVVDDLIVTLALVLFSQLVGVQPGEYVADPDGRPPDRELVARQCRHVLRLAGRAPAGRAALPPPAPRPVDADRAPHPGPQLRAGLPDLGHPVRHGDLRRASTARPASTMPLPMPTTAAAGSPSR